MSFSPTRRLLFLVAVQNTVQAFHLAGPLAFGLGKIKTKSHQNVPDSQGLSRHRHLVGSTQNSDGQGEPDLFDYFDPLLSPHAYPNGISPENTPLDEQEMEQTKPASLDAGGSSSPFGFRLEDATASGISPASSLEEDWDFGGGSVFDPLLSPHAYPHGTPDQVIGNDEEAQRRERAAAASGSEDAATKTHESSSRRVGILLIDHGSRNQDSNSRLHELAVLYQEQFFAESSSKTSSNNIVVRAAHMEIAEPNIKQALQTMMEDHILDEIVIHPFFLSPLGRHVSEDIPQILDQAKEELAIDIPITTTEPVGAEVQILMQAVHSQVRQSLRRMN